jgi:hypothetical protein
VFKNCKSKLAGYFITEDDRIAFSPLLAEQESATGCDWNSGLSESGLENRGLSRTASTVAASSYDNVDNLYIVPLEDAVVIAMLAALQAYIRSDSRNGLYNVDDAVNILRSDTQLAIGFSRVPGSIPAETIKTILQPTAFGGVSITDTLFILGRWVQYGSSIHMPLPEAWIIPDTPHTEWPSFFSSTVGVMIVRRDAVGHVIAGAADREFYVRDAGVRTGERGDGAVYFVLSCIHDPPLPTVDDAAARNSNLALGCMRHYLFEL